MERNDKMIHIDLDTSGNISNEEMNYFMKEVSIVAEKEKEQIELMANEIIAFLKKKKMWETDTGLIYNGKHVQHSGVSEKHENLKGVMRMWFEGPLYRAINHGAGDRNYSIYKGLTSIMERHGYYPEFDSLCDFNIYPI